MEAIHEVITLNLPKRFQPEDEYSSHRPLLYLGLVMPFIEKVFEFGCGYGSTPLLTDMDVPFESFETNKEWAAKFPQTTYVEDYSMVNINAHNSMIFIDSKPGEDRKAIAWLFKHRANLIIIHDTQPSAEYVYGMSQTIDGFIFKCRLDISGMPSTSVMSMFHNIEDWKNIRFEGLNAEIV